MATPDSAMMEDLLEPLTEALTPESARRLSGLRAKPAVQARVDDLAAKCNEGKLTDEERAEYEDYVRVGQLFALIKAKAKRVLAESTNG